MNRYLRSIYTLMLILGFDPRKTFRVIKRLPQFFHHLQLIKLQHRRSHIPFRFAFPLPYLDDTSSDSGTAKGHYFHQDLLIARRIFINNPKRHIDIGSRIDGLVAHVASFREIEVFDIRPLSTDIPNVTFTMVDLMSNLDPSLVDCSDSLSCLHALEHFGLGRYGNPISYDGFLSALKNMHRILKPNGKFYLSIPIGPQRIEFNAHRVFSLKYLLGLF